MTSLVKTRVVLRPSADVGEVPTRGLSRRELTRIGHRRWSGIRAALIVGAALTALMIAGFVRKHDREMLRRLDTPSKVGPVIQHAP